jgi:outer membrane immunogenic protein
VTLDAPAAEPRRRIDDVSIRVVAKLHAGSAALPNTGIASPMQVFNSLVVAFCCNSAHKECTRMKLRILSLLAGTAALALTTAASLAADLPSAFAPASILPSVPTFTWTGFYAGAQAAYGFGGDETRVFLNGAAVELGAPADFDTDGFLGSVHAGFNLQYGSVVSGVEGDFEASGVEGKSTVINGSVSSITSSEVTIQGSLRTRVGVAFDRAFIYGTAGFAIAHIGNRYRYDNGAGITATAWLEDVNWGWTMGVGSEYAFTNNLTARVEYRYTQFDTYLNPMAVGADSFDVRQEASFHSTRMGVSYKFQNPSLARQPRGRKCGLARSPDTTDACAVEKA